MKIQLACGAMASPIEAFLQYSLEARTKLGQPIFEVNLLAQTSDGKWIHNVKRLQTWTESAI